MASIRTAALQAAHRLPINSKSILRLCVMFSAASACGDGRARLSHYCLEGAQERQTGRTKIGTMRKRDLAQYFFSTGCQTQQNLTAVLAITSSLQEAMRFETISKFNGAVVLNLKAFGQKTHCGAG